MRNSENISDEVLLEAGKWIARETADDMTGEERFELEKLLVTDVDFQLAYLEICKSANLLETLSTRAGKEELATLAPEFLDLPEFFDPIEDCDDPRVRSQGEPRPFARFSGWGSVVAASFALLIVAATLFFRDGSIATTYETKVGDNEIVMLKDGSIITLNTDTRISVALSESERRVFLGHGEAYFDVAKDKTRPFTVLIGDDVVKAVGTAFNIKRRAEVTKVTVTEGVVEIKKSPDMPTSDRSAYAVEPVSLEAGKNLTIDPNGKRTNIALSPAELDDMTSWRKGMLHFKGERLGAIVHEIQYYIPKEIILTSDQVSEIIVGGSLDTENVLSFLKGLERTFPIHVIERDMVIIVSYKQKSPSIISASGT